MIYTFLVAGMDIEVCDQNGSVCVNSVHSPAFQLAAAGPSSVVGEIIVDAEHPIQPPSKEEILRLIKADAGNGFLTNDITVETTNGVVSVYVGKGELLDSHYIPKLTIIFGPDGNLAAYMRY
jgi:hypothetical protein